MKIDSKKLIFCIALPLLVGGVAGFLTRDSVELYGMINKPPLSPPGWLFPIVWTILYILMGISSYIIMTSQGESQKINQALKTYYVQLFVNFMWPIFFFSFQWYGLALLWLLLLWILVARMNKQFGEISKVAAYLNIPYLLWLTFALYLNGGVVLGSK